MKWWLLSTVVVLLLIVSAAVTSLGLINKQQRAGLQILTPDKPTSVFLDGIYLNKTPMVEKNLKPGEHVVKLVPEDSAQSSAEETVRLHPGTLTVVSWHPGTSPELAGLTIYEMEKLPDTRPFWQRWQSLSQSQLPGELKFVSIPDNAILRVSTQEDPTYAPLDLSLTDPSKVEFSAQLPSYEEQKHTVEVKPGYRITVLMKLARLTAMPTSLAQTDADTTVLGVEDSPAASPSAIASAAGTLRIKPTGFRWEEEEVLKLRVEPSATASVSGYIPVGKEVPFTSTKTQDWRQVMFNDQLGWVNTQFVTIVGNRE